MHSTTGLSFTPPKDLHVLHAVARDVGVLFILDVVIYVDGNVRIFVNFNDAPIFVQIRNYFENI